MTEAVTAQEITVTRVFDAPREAVWKAWFSNDRAALEKLIPEEVIAIGNDTEAILIDAGISCRETEKRMKRLGLSMEKVKAILIISGFAKCGPARCIFHILNPITYFVQLKNQ